MTIVELQRIDPGGEVGVAAVGDHVRTGDRRQPIVISRLAGQVLGTAVNVELEMGSCPGVIDGGVIGNEIKH